jgi:preprotein translocase subunit SecF
MIRLLANANYDFVGARRIAYLATAVFLVPGLLLLALRGFNYSIEFTGGTLVQVSMSRQTPVAELREALRSGGLPGAEMTTFGSEREFVIRARLSDTAAVSEAEAQRTARQVTAALAQAFGQDFFTVDRVEAVGPKVGGELRQKALIAILLSFIVVMVYLAFRFEFRFGLAAVVATGHDILATLAFIQYLNIEVSLVVVSAILTVIGYSLNDTIVIFDRVRENLHKYKRDDFPGILNRSVNETLPRTILTGGATILALLSLLILAGEIIRPFAWVMLFGVVVGTFSSVFIASPVLLAIERRWPGQDVRGVKARVVSAGSTTPPGLAAPSQPAGRTPSA